MFGRNVWWRRNEHLQQGENEIQYGCNKRRHLETLKQCYNNNNNDARMQKETALLYNGLQCGVIECNGLMRIRIVGGRFQKLYSNELDRTNRNVMLFLVFKFAMNNKNAPGHATPMVVLTYLQRELTEFLKIPVFTLL